MRPRADVVADLIVFELGASRCALDLRVIREVIPLGPVTPVPTAPSAVVGAVNVHGQVVAVLDLGPLLGLPSAGRPRQGGGGLLAVAQGTTLVLHVTRVCEVVQLVELQLDPEPARLARSVATEIGELLLIDLGRVIERVQGEIAGHAGHPLPPHSQFPAQADDERFLEEHGSEPGPGADR